MKGDVIPFRGTGSDALRYLASTCGQWSTTR